MARIAGINIPINKVVHTALTYIHGIGDYNSKLICQKLNIPLNKRVNKILNSAEKVIANSEYTKNLSIQSGVEQEKVVVINPGVSPPQELNKTSLTKVESLLKTNLSKYCLYLHWLWRRRAKFKRFGK